MTALILAVIQGHAAVAEALLTAGAKPDLQGVTELLTDPAQLRPITTGRRGRMRSKQRAKAGASGPRARVPQHHDIPAHLDASAARLARAMSKAERARLLAHGSESSPRSAWTPVDRPKKGGKTVRAVRSVPTAAPAFDPRVHRRREPNAPKETQARRSMSSLGAYCTHSRCVGTAPAHDAPNDRTQPVHACAGSMRYNGAPVAPPQARLGEPRVQRASLPSKPRRAKRVPKRRMRGRPPLMAPQAPPPCTPAVSSAPPTSTAGASLASASTGNVHGDDLTRCIFRAVRQLPAHCCA